MVSLSLVGCDDNTEALTSELRRLRERVEQAQGEYDMGYEAGRAAAQAELKIRGTRQQIGWGFVFGSVTGLCLAALLNARRLEDAVRRRFATRSHRQLLRPAAKTLDPEVQNLADTLSDRYALLKERVRKERNFKPLMEGVVVHLDALVMRSARMLSVLQELNESVRGAGERSTDEETERADKWHESLRHAEANIAECRRKVQATIDLIDSILLRLAGLRLASLDAASLSAMAGEISDQIAFVEEAYRGLPSAAPRLRTVKHRRA